MCGFHQIDTAHSGHYRDPKQLHQPLKAVICTCQSNSMTCKDHRTHCLFQFFQNLLHHLFCHRSRKFFLILFRIVRSQIIGFYDGTLYIQRKIQPARSRTTRFGQIDRPLQMIPDRKRIRHHDGIFCHGFYGRRDVIFLHSHRTDL